MNHSGEICLAVDVGGTKCAAGLVTSEGRLLVRRQVATSPVEPGAGAEGLFLVLARLVKEVMALAEEVVPSAPLAVCGVGCGGPMTRGGTEVSPLNIPVWRRFPLLERLREVTGLPTAVDNDAKALALAEGWVGAAAGLCDFLAMVVSTGVGGGIVLDGRLLDGGDGNAGHIGHVIVEPEGRQCACGAFGCLEAEASGTAIAAITGKPPAEASPLIVSRAGLLVGRAVASVCNLLDLPLAVVAGSVALGFGPPFFDAASAELASRARLRFSSGSKIVPAGLGADGPLIGAAAVGWR
ncbi:MAG TPA: ROK family protein, partial [Acidimicrobiales bacterium]|nr:ROK family protein [Acidimicrobiales bacterium]